MRKTLAVAWREFWATVGTKGFILGVFLPLIIMGGALTLMPILMNKSAPAVTGRIGVIDHSGAVADKLAKAFSPEEIKARTEKRVKRRLEQAGQMNPAMADEQSKKQAEAALQAMFKAPELSIDILGPDTDLDAAKAPIMEVVGKAGDAGAANQRLALAVIPAGAVKAGETGGFTPYEFFIAPKLDPEVQDDIRDQISRAVVDARLEAAGLEAANVRSIIEQPRSETRVVTKEGERSSNEAAALLMPMGFMLLLWISVITGGQSLLSSTVEEKSSRIMEVLLSAVSPMQLMVGKIMGQMGVALVILLVYAALGVGSLAAFRQMHMLDPMLLVYLGIFFVLGFFMVASMMAAIGSAVNDIREAQALMGPVMMVLVIPMVLWLPISRNPNSTFAQICSYLPPVNPFIMVVRLAGSEEIPAWQIPISILTALIGAVVCAWFAAKVFRIGVLMYGKPPNFRTLLKWVRMA